MASTRKPSRNSALDVAGLIGQAVAKHAPKGSRLCVALSGGVDSMVLLDALAKNAAQHAWRLRCIHVHHGLSPNADSWLAFCKRVARARGIECETVRVDLCDDSKRGQLKQHGVEAAARDVRYKVFAQQAADFVVLAHHRDDQAETVLLQLMRGCGVAGAAAMGQSRALGPAGPTLLRPMLDVSRREIERYAKRRRLKWVIDESNQDRRFARNALRLDVMPLLAQLNSEAAQNIARSARYFAEANDLLVELAHSDLSGAAKSGCLRVSSLRALGDVRARNALRQLLADAGAGRLAASRLHEAWRQIACVYTENSLRLQLGGVLVMRHRDELWLMQACADSTQAPALGSQVSRIQSWNGLRRWALADDLGVIQFRSTRGAGIARRFLQPGQVHVATRCGGERLRPVASRPSRSLKNLFQEAGVPPWQRKQPLLFIDTRLAWVPALGIDSSFQAEQGEASMDVRWQPSSNSVR